MQKRCQTARLLRLRHNNCHINEIELFYFAEPKSAPAVRRWLSRRDGGNQPLEDRMFCGPCVDLAPLQSADIYCGRAERRTLRARTRTGRFIRTRLLLRGSARQRPRIARAAFNRAALEETLSLRQQHRP